MSDILAGIKSCASCAARAKMMAMPEAQRVQLALNASMAASAKTGVNVPGYIARFGPVWGQVRTRLDKARKRCTDPGDAGFSSYGGRGIKFVFASVSEATLWVLESLGAPPPRMSIDRIDNNGHYEPGNLRWATSKEQNSNKREYKRATEGDRVRELARVRPDLTEQTIRTWIKKGASDAEITNRRKHVGCGVRHTELRSES